MFPPNELRNTLNSKWRTRFLKVDWCKKDEFGHSTFPCCINFIMQQDVVIINEDTSQSRRYRSRVRTAPCSLFTKGKSFIGDPATAEFGETTQSLLFLPFLPQTYCLTLISRMNIFRFFGAGARMITRGPLRAAITERPAGLRVCLEAVRAGHANRVLLHHFEMRESH